MKTVVTECPRCGSAAELPSTSVLVDVGSSDGDEAVAGTASWVCATCRDVVSHPVTWASLLVLVEAGAPLFDEDDDPRPPHPESSAAGPAGPALTYDDLLDLHVLLEDPAWPHEVAGAAGPTSPQATRSES